MKTTMQDPTSILKSRSLADGTPQIGGLEGKMEKHTCENVKILFKNDKAKTEGLTKTQTKPK